ncbi:hypothetical protein ACGGAQ_29995 [Micromonospora sp. NPDC047557]|uniref:hypothetical protein n=1 Tax=Micromonospora sp. NPDC047557 TaxID=3364250 RepID=UPI003713C7FA
MKLGVGRALTGVAALTVAAVVVFPGSAAASPEPPGDGWDHVFSAKGVTVYVEEYGDIVSVCDSLANGYAATVFVESGAGTLFYSAKASNGAGTCTTHRASEGGKYNLPEKLSYTVVYDGSEEASDLSVFYNDH